jgi:hypothetical protein
MLSNHQASPFEQVRQVLRRFQDYYTRRDPALLDTFLELLVADDLEVIGTNGLRPGESEWYLGKAAARALFLSDWQSWGDLRLDVPNAQIRLNGKTAWLSAAGVVAMHLPAEKNYTDFLAFIRQYLDSDTPSAEEKLLYLLRGSSNTLYELRRGSDFVWPLRFTAVLAQHTADWRFQHMHFSFPTLYFPDARLVD